ncbi:hypothetical protein Syun_020948 [Stephania yunnanensis]|uniref:Uncharacterized protein n=1 Tax=Stephania yunnanensis TaxID=152371 RepID=A0AAP0IG38_9MAGN
MFTLFPCVFVYGRRDGDLERCVGRGLPFHRFLSFEALGGSLTSDQHVSSFDREEGVLISSHSGPSRFTVFLEFLFYDEPGKDSDWRLSLIWNASTSLLVGDTDSEKNGEEDDEGESGEKEGDEDDSDEEGQNADKDREGSESGDDEESGEKEEKEDDVDEEVEVVEEMAGAKGCGKAKSGTPKGKKPVDDAQKPDIVDEFQ